MKLLPFTDVPALSEDPSVLVLANDADPLQAPLQGIQRIDLFFPKFTDGRAFSQAFLLRRRREFRGEIRATGDVLVDQLAQMERSGFDSAVLRADQDMGIAQRVLSTYPGYGVGRYQGDAVHVTPHFADAGQV
ncbi:DUF934 domain-containing protein [Polaromonas sp. SM01]|uniref:DUF934 domain-containing protein n=1 Tax=Polaromonas sp. SM01 TaxID=3085630 RepID=UPI00298108C4|nr:DUF934 domain-containing protein [Polaromonas sp. SM01]MDW5444273.1 DUF934 domain-containing protein [Polaromonas sp. SM01]